MAPRNSFMLFIVIMATIVLAMIIFATVTGRTHAMPIIPMIGMAAVIGLALCIWYKGI